jgi:hypothetical protein
LKIAEIVTFSGFLKKLEITRKTKSDFIKTPPGSNLRRHREISGFELILNKP